MSSAHVRGLSYGLLGEAKYDNSTNHWSHQRIPGIGRTFHPLGPVRTILEASVPPGIVPISHGGQERRKKIRQITDTEPDLAAAGNLLSSLAQVSQAAVEATVASEPPPRDLISFGLGVRFSPSGQSTRSVELVAVAAGVSGEAVKVLWLRPDRRRLKSQPGQDLPIPGFDAKEAAWWIGAANSPVEQICFSERSDGPGSWLAVRNSLGTTILRPVLRSRMVAQTPLFDEAYHQPISMKPSYLDANIFASITNNDTAKTLHIYVSFNPWLERQIAILDSNGHWHIYESTVRSTYGANDNDAHKLTRTQFSDAPLTIDDQWGIILWAGGPDTIVVASRSAINIYRLGEKLKTFTIPGLDLENNEAIIDLRRHSTHPAHIFILTSNQLCCYRVYSDSELDRLEDEQPAAVLLLAWRHQLNPNDMTQRIVLQDTGDSEDTSSRPIVSDRRITGTILVLVYSKKTDLVICYTFSIGQNEDIGYSTSDPFSLSTKLFCSADEAKAGVSCTISVRQLMSPRRDEHNARGPLYYNEYPVFSLIQLSSDLGAHERILALCGSLDSNHLPHYWSAGSRAIQHPRMLVVHDDFIVPDGTEVQKLSYRYGADLIVDKSPPTPDVLAQEWLAGIMHDQIETTRQDVMPSGSFDEAIERVLSERAELDIGLYTAADFLSTKLPVDELEKFSTTVQEILDGISEVQHPGSSHPGMEADQPPISAHLLLTADLASIFKGDLEGSAGVLLVPLYEKLLQTQISRLGQQVPGKTRVLLEREFRKVAMRLYLATYGVRSVNQTYRQVNRQLPLSMNSDDMTLTFRHRIRSDLQDAGQSSTAVSEIDPGYASYQPTIGTNLSSSMPPCDSTQPPIEEPALPLFQSLSTFLNFKEPPFNSSANNLVEQWDIGTNPAQFNWQTARRARVTPATRPQTPRKGLRAKLQQSQRMEPRSSQNLQTGPVSILPEVASRAQYQDSRAALGHTRAFGEGSSQAQPAQTAISKPVAGNTQRSSPSPPKARKTKKKKKAGFK
ncbi:MAG: hypothetical protein MMC23_000542 [Stictis urceolatum]|nr:hypothetical protein [Stictis urceolata]